MNLGTCVETSKVRHSAASGASQRLHLSMCSLRPPWSPPVDATVYPYSLGALTSALLHVPIGIQYIRAPRARGGIERSDWAGAGQRLTAGATSLSDRNSRRLAELTKDDVGVRADRRQIGCLCNGPLSILNHELHLRGDERAVVWVVTEPARGGQHA